MTSARLHHAGAAVVKLDPTADGQNVDPEQWYYGLLTQLGLELGIEDELNEFWEAQFKWGAFRRWREALLRVVLKRFEQRVVIFIDEIDYLRSLKFSTDEFLAGIWRRSDVIRHTHASGVGNTEGAYSVGEAYCVLPQRESLGHCFDG